MWIISLLPSFFFRFKPWITVRAQHIHIACIYPLPTSYMYIAIQYGCRSQKYLYTRKKSSVSNAHCWSLWTPLIRKLLAVFSFSSKEQKLKTTGTRADYFWTTHNFLQRATIVTSFDVRWSLVVQAIPENKLFLSKLSIFRNRYYMLSKILPCDINLNLLLSIHSSYLPLLWSVPMR